MNLLQLLLGVFNCSNYDNLPAKLPSSDKIACHGLADYPHKYHNQDCFVSRDVLTPVPEMITNHGYPVEAHELTTEDGYILTLFRIPPKGNVTGAQPVFIQHGSGVDSSHWVDIEERSLAFNLVDRGYDVWLGNIRGTRYSRRHKKLKPCDFEYWLYNVDMLTTYDLRASLNKVVNVTGEAGNIIYIGHSMGSIMFLQYASDYPEEAASVLKGGILMSPAAYLDLSDELKPLFDNYGIIADVLLYFNISGVPYPMEPVIEFLQYFCSEFPYVCREAINFLFGNTVQYLPEDLLTFYSYYPTSSAVNQTLQFSQMARSDKFQKFDYGNEGNLAKYGQTDPPLYNLSEVTVPTFLYYGKNDALINERGATRVYNELGSQVKELKSVPVNNQTPEYQFDHLDFVFSEFLEEFFYVDLFQVIKYQLARN